MFSASGNLLTSLLQRETLQIDILDVQTVDEMVGKLVFNSRRRSVVVSEIQLSPDDFPDIFWRRRGSHSSGWVEM